MNKNLFVKTKILLIVKTLFFKHSCMDQKRKSQLEKEALKLMTSYLQEHLPEMQKEFGMVYINRLKISQDLSY